MFVVSGVGGEGAPMTDLRCAASSCTSMGALDISRTTGGLSGCVRVRPRAGMSHSRERRVGEPAGNEAGGAGNGGADDRGQMIQHQVCNDLRLTSKVLP